MIAALLVIYGHSYALSPADGYSDVLRKLNLPGSHRLGLYVFFVVSGYLITSSIQRRNLWFFIQSRLLRIVPAMAVSAVLTIAALSPFTSLPLGEYLHRAARFIIFNVSLAVGTSGGELGLFANNPYRNHVNGALWSISLEVACYLGILAITVWTLLSNSLLRILGYFAIAYIVILHPPGDLSRNLQFTCVAYFMAGSVIYWARNYFPISTWIAGAFAVSLACLPALPREAWGYIQHPAVVYGTFFLAFFHKINEPPGDYSYGTYLYGFPAQQSVAAIAPLLVPPVHFAYAVVIALPLGVLSWHLVEKPMLGLKGSLRPWMYVVFPAFVLAYLYVAMIADRWLIILVAICAAGGLVRLLTPIGRDIVFRMMK